MSVEARVTQRLSPVVSPGGRKRKSFDETLAPQLEKPADVSSDDDSTSSTGQSKAEGVEGQLLKPIVSKTGWTDEEDSVVVAAVRAMGTQWQAVASRLPGRTSDAVRNRWHRLQKRGMASSTAGVDRGTALESSTPPSLTAERSRSHHAPLGREEDAGAAVIGSDHGRSRWSVQEDRAIEIGVRTLGCRWRQIAATLPGRSDSSIRNRWQRLLRGQAAMDEESIPEPALSPSVACSRSSVGNVAPSSSAACCAASEPERADSQPHSAATSNPIESSPGISLQAQALSQSADAPPSLSTAAPRAQARAATAGLPSSTASPNHGPPVPSPHTASPVAPDRQLALALVAFASQSLDTGSEELVTSEPRSKSPKLAKTASPKLAMPRAELTQSLSSPSSSPSQTDPSSCLAARGASDASATSPITINGRPSSDVLDVTMDVSSEDATVTDGAGGVSSEEGCPL